MMRGIISTLSNPKGSIYIPVAAPIVLRKPRKRTKPEARHYRERPAQPRLVSVELSTVLTEEFGIFAVPQVSVQRKGGAGGKA